MAGEIASAFVRVRPNMSGFKSETESGVKSAFGGLGSIANGAFGAVSKAATAGALAIGAVGAAATVSGFKFDSMQQQAEIAFTTMLGSGAKAKAFLGDLQKFAASTPFDFPGLTTAASSLISIGIDSSKVIPIMRTLGDVTSGMGTGAEGIKRATVALQQMNAAGRIQAEDLNQLRDAGVPVYDLLSAAIGKSKAEVAKMAQTGKLGREELEKLMNALETGKGLERFSGLMDKQSRSFQGLWSTIKDTWGQISGKVMKPFFDLATAGLQKIVDFTSKASFTDGITKFGDGVEKIVKAFMAAKGFHAKVSFIWEGVEDVGRSLYDRLSDVVSQINWGGIWGRAGGIAQGLAERFKTIDWGNVGAAIGDGIANAVTQATGNIKKFADGFAALMRSIDWNSMGREMGPGLAAAIVSAFATLTDPSFWIRNWDLALAIGITAFGGSIGRVAGRLLAPFSRMFSGVLLELAGLLERLSPRLAEAVLSGVLRLPALLSRIWGSITAEVTSVFPRLGRLAQFVVKVLGVQAVIDSVADLARRLYAGIQGIIDWIRDHWRQVTVVLLAPFAPVVAAAAGIFGLKDALLGALNGLLGTVADIAAGLGRAIVSGVMAGLGGLFSGIVDKAGSQIRGALGWLKGHLGSTAEEHAADTVGKPLGQGVILGFLLGLSDLPSKISAKIRDSLTKARDSVQRLQSTLGDAFSRLGQYGIQAFEAATDRQLAKMQTAFQAKIKRLITDPLKRAMDALDAQNKAALSSIDANQRELTPAEKQLKDMQDAHDAAARQQSIADARAALAKAQSAPDSDTKAADILSAQRTLDDALYAEQVSQLQRQADTERAARDAEAEAARTAQQTAYETEQAAIQARFDARQAQLQHEYDQQVLNYQSQRNLQEQNLNDTLDRLNKSLALHPEAWKSINETIQKMFKTSFGPQYKTAGKNLGKGFAKGIREAIDDVADAARAMAAEVEKYLKVRSPTEAGPMSDLNTWWARLGDTLVAPLSQGSLAAALTSALALPRGAALPSLAGLGTPVPQITGALSPLGRLVLLQEETLAELRKQTQAIGEAEPPSVTVQTKDGKDFNSVAQEARR